MGAQQGKNTSQKGWAGNPACILIQCTWGLAQSLAGAIIFLLNLKRRHFVFHSTVVTQWNLKSSVSLGLFVFVATVEGGHGERIVPRALLLHEYGHTIQSLILGPLYLPVIGISSALWGILPCARKRRAQGASYFSFWTEDWANRLAERVTGERIC